ncbi:MAG: glycosyltransferase [Alphaproteobacteria bacterium]
MRILQAIAGARHGGAEMHFVRLAVALSKAGVEQRVVMRPDSARASSLRAAGIDVVEAPFGGLLDTRTRRLLKREVERFRPRIVLTYMSRATRLCRKGPYPGGDFTHVARLGGYYDPKYYRQCDHLVCITPDIAAYCVKGGFPAERVHVIPNFVEDQKPSPVRRSDFATPDDAPLVFALGRLHENKAFDVLLQAIALRPGVHLWLAGDGPERESLEALAARLGVAERVRFLGWQEDPGPFFAAADVFVVPSRHEPLGSVVLEGWMHRLPMVAAASQGPSFLIEDGKTGLLVPVDDAQGLAGGLARLLGDKALARRLADAGRARFESDFTVEAAVARYLDLFRKIAP